MNSLTLYQRQMEKQRECNYEKLSGDKASVEVLKAEKTEHAFDLISSATMELFTAFYDADT